MKKFQHSRPYLGPSRSLSGARSQELYNKSLLLLNDNEEEAFRLNEAAAESGMRDAILAMGWFYLRGIGVGEDRDRARRWYRMSARQGDARAMFSLGQIALIEEEIPEALSWFNRAERKGHSRSKFWIGKIYWKGRGVDQDRKRARHLFAEAAALKVEEAQRTLRFLDYLGRRS